MAKNLELSRSDIAMNALALPHSRVFSPRIAAGLLAIGDGLVVFLAGLLVYLTYLGWDVEGKVQLYLTAMAGLGLYHREEAFGLVISHPRL